MLWRRTVLIYRGRPQDALNKMKPTATQDPNYPYF